VIGGRVLSGGGNPSRWTRAGRKELRPPQVSGDRLYLAFTRTNGGLNVESSTNGIVFGNKVTLGQSTGSAPPLSALLAAGNGRTSRLVFRQDLKDLRFFGGEIWQVLRCRR
jgi:hypothetical protein